MLKITLFNINKFGFLKIVFIFAPEKDNPFFLITCWRSLLVLKYEKLRIFYDMFKE
jgi:hypothetical protein